jgi:DNA-binding NarL/FixJ family response regulator
MDEGRLAELESAPVEFSVSRYQMITILQELANGKDRQTIAAKLCVHSHTVTNKLCRIYDFMGVPNQSAAVAEALRRGWIQ